MEKEKVFAEGIIFKRNDNAPDFVIGSMSVKVEEFVPFLQANSKNGWTNLNVKKSQSGKIYVELDTFEPKPQGAPAPQQASAPAPQQAQPDLPF
jgi:hypothetical protein